MPAAARVQPRPDDCSGDLGRESTGRAHYTKSDTPPLLHGVVAFSPAIPRDGRTDSMQSSFRYRRSCLAAVVVSVVLGVLVPIGSASAGSVILPDPCTLLTSLASSDAGAALGISGGRPTLYSSSPPVLWCDEVVNGSRGTFAVGLTTSHAGAKDGLPDAKGHTTYPSGLGSGATLEEDPLGEDTHGAIPGARPCASTAGRSLSASTSATTTPLRYWPSERRSTSFSAAACFR